ncbi:MAG: hypothetical protein IT357_06480 [Gemmatimonadaceae bacterium]|nr:hypothetical protein [Gemmatimonadaceae bacterium]
MAAPQACVIGGAAVGGLLRWLAVGVLGAVAADNVRAGMGTSNSLPAPAPAPADATALWANNRALGARISGEMNVIVEHFGFLSGAGGPEKGDPDDPRNRDKWKKDIARHIREAQKYIDRLKGDRNKDGPQRALDEVTRRLGETP